MPDIPQEHTKPYELNCGRCDGTGKVTFCPLCNNTGVFSVYVDGEDGTASHTGYWSARVCPNGCPKPEVRF